MEYAEGKFLGIGPEFTDPDTARYAVLPVPYDGTASYLKGCAEGPAAIIAASPQMEWIDDELRIEAYRAGIATLDAVEPCDDPAEMMSRIAAAARPVVQRGQFLLTLGGEHSIVGPVVREVVKKHGALSVLQIDAHTDLRDEFEGSPHSHACVMRRVLEVTDSICQVGIRSFSEDELADLPGRIDAAITARHVQDDPDWIDRVLSMLDEKVYVTVDIDGLDPSIAPGVGTPEPGGLTWRNVTDLLRHVCRRREVVAADVVETRPIPGQVTTEFLAARLAYKIIAYTQQG
ncbi:MAG: agmatinase [Phycisphaerae bacterium]